MLTYLAVTFGIRPTSFGAFAVLLPWLRRVGFWGMERTDWYIVKII